MALAKIEERTLYRPLIDYLESIGFKALGETTVSGKHPDILFQTDSLSFVIEIKIGKPEIGLKAVAQASDYARKLNTQNVIVLIYPEKYRAEPAFTANVSKLALEEEIQALVLTEYWTESLAIKPAVLFEKLQAILTAKKIKVDLKTVIDLIEVYVRDLNTLVYQIKTDELVSEVVNKLDLFSSIGEIKDKKTAKNQVINLSSFLLFNQLLFYHIFKKRNPNAQLVELEEIKHVQDIQKYFDKITRIDYQSIYQVNILGHIPEKDNVIGTLNDLIKAIKLLRVEHKTEDLAGRFFHDLIPQEVRKVLAAFYTHPRAADLLVNLLLDSWDETIIDPACGSGTLLVSAYKRKQELYNEIHGYHDFKKMHKQFIENDLTGIDIMPFAAHITTINLTTQNIEQQTNTVRVGIADSLQIAKSLKSEDFRKMGVPIAPYTESIQKTLEGIHKIEKIGAVSPEGKSKEFFLKPVDAVIMNPPFSDREKMPKEMREKIKKNETLGKVCGHQVNLWGYFLALADLLLKPSGKLGAVIPINIARGKATEKIRNFLFSNYCIKYIIKPIGDFAFSEGAAFKDILLIAEKKKPTSSDLACLIFLKKRVKTMPVEEVSDLINKIKKIEKGQNYSDDEIIVTWYACSYLEKNRDDLMKLLSMSPSASIFQDFIAFVAKKGKSKKLNAKLLREGFRAYPKGLSELVFITNPINESRATRGFLILNTKDQNELVAKIKDTEFEFKVPIGIVIPALRTLTGLNRFDITSDHDYMITKPFADFDKLVRFSKWRSNINVWNVVEKNSKGIDTNLAIVRRINPYSKNSHLISFYSEKKFVPNNTLFPVFLKTKEEAKILCLEFNSIIGLVQFLFNKEETTGSWTELRISDLSTFITLDCDKLSKSELEHALLIFEKHKKTVFPSLLDQFQNRFKARVELDEEVLKRFGLSQREIDDWLPKIYDLVAEELKSFKKLRVTT